MKKIILLALGALLLGSCCNEARLRTGDLLFVGIPIDYSLDSSEMASGIAEATGSGKVNFIHVSILEVEKDTTWIIDATIKRGVARYPLSDYLEDFRLKDGSLPVLEVMRPDGKASEMRRYVENAKRFIGEPYDVHFLPDNGHKYCSELVYDSYITEKGEHLFSAAPMNFLDSEGNMPVYWTQLFRLLGEEVPQGIPGTNPQAMRTEPILRLLEQL